VITAAHCLPSFPPCASISDIKERTYEGLISELGGKPTIWTECLFVDPVADIAVLGPPDEQALSKEREAYDMFVNSLVPLPIADVPEGAPAWVLSLDNQWNECIVRHYSTGPKKGALWIFDARAGIRGGMSGSPIIAKICSWGCLRQHGVWRQIVSYGRPKPSLGAQSSRLAFMPIERTHVGLDPFAIRRPFPAGWLPDIGCEAWRVEFSK
jgi:hypothetical protein